MNSHHNSFGTRVPNTETEFVALPVQKTGDEFPKPLVGRGAAYADIDNDGDLDLVLAAAGQPARLLRNDHTTPSIIGYVSS